MSILSGLLTFVLVINCLMLIGLVLIQLPKKDAGAGLAFGAGAADALFGAGSGNALTTITKWATVAFLVICLALGMIMESVNSKGDATDFMKKVQQKQSQVPAMTPLPSTAPVPQASAKTPAAIPAAATAVVSTNAVK